MFFRRRKEYDRESCLEAAAREQSKGRVRKAAAHYLRALEADPEDHFVHAKVAPLLAKMQRFEESWESFRIAASRYFATGFSQKAIGIYSQAAKFMPRNPEVWEAMAYVYVQQGKRADAVATLYKGHAFFTRGACKDRAVAMLRRAFALDPWNPEVTLALARHLKKSDPVEALGLLEGLSIRVKGRKLRHVRSAMFCARPGFTMAWRWFKAAWIEA